MIVYFSVNNWFGYNDPALDRFVDDLVNDLDLEVSEIGVNYSWEVVDMAAMFYVTTTIDWLTENNLLSALKFSQEKTEEFPEYDPDKIGTSENRKYIGEEER